MRAAAELLSKARSTQELAEILYAVGIEGETVRLEESDIGHLGIDALQASLVGKTDNQIRALLLRLRSGQTIRNAVPAIARRLALRTPHVRWLIAVIEAEGERAGIVGWISDSKAQRLVSLVWEPHRVVNSDAESLCALAAIRVADPELFHARCLEVLGRDVLTRRFYRALEERVQAMALSLTPRAENEDARTMALLYVSRLLFLSFLEAKGWLNGERDFLSTRFDECMVGHGSFHRRVLLPL